MYDVEERGAIACLLRSGDIFVEKILFLPALYELQALNSGHQACTANPLPTHLAILLSSPPK